MVLWLLNHLSTWALSWFIVGGLVVLALIGCLGVRRKFPATTEGEHNDVTGVVLSIFGAIYGIILAFVIVILWEQYQSAESLASTESTALSQVIRAARAFPPQAQVSMREAVGTYTLAVAEDEWPAMRKGEASPRAAAALDNLYATLQAHQAQTANEITFYEVAASALDEVTSTRRERLEDSRQGLPGLFQVLIFAGAFVLIALTYLLGIRSKLVQLLFVGTVAMLVGFSLLLVVVMDRPFAGEVSIGTEPFKEEILAEFWTTDKPLTKLYPVEKLSPEDIVGVWNSYDYGVIVFRQVGSELHGVYRYDIGTIVGTVSDGVFHGWWCEGPTRKPPEDAGDVEFRLVRTPDGTTLDGRWRSASEKSFKENWDLRDIGSAEPPDLAARFSDAGTFCSRP